MMKKKIVLAVLCLLLAVTAVLRSYADAVPGVQAAGVHDFDVPCAAAVLIDEDSGTVLYEKNADERRPVASITKVMTLLLTFEALQAAKLRWGISCRSANTPTIWAAARSGWSRGSS